MGSLRSRHIRLDKSHFGITYKIRWPCRWSDTKIHIGGSIRVIFFLFLFLEVDYELTEHSRDSELDYFRAVLCSSWRWGWWRWWWCSSGSSSDWFLCFILGFNCGAAFMDIISRLPNFMHQQYHPLDSLALNGYCKKWKWNHKPLDSHMDDTDVTLIHLYQTILWNRCLNI